MTTQARPPHSLSPNQTKPTDSALQLRLLGGVSAAWQGQKLAVSAPRMLGMLAYLHLHGPTPRSELIDIFWPGQGAQAVRQALYTLRGLPGASEWLSDGPEVHLHASSDVQQARELLHERQDTAALALLNPAGPLLGSLTIQGAPEFDEWQAQEREELQQAHAAALRRQAHADLARQDYMAARKGLEKLLHLDPLEESSYRELMQLEHQAGRHAEMLEVFESLRQTLHRELGSEPEPETLALLHHLEGHEISGQTRARLLKPEHLPELNLDSPLRDALCGREADLEALQQKLIEKNRALVQGMAGMGKTRLAWAAAEQSLESGQNVLWLELGGDPPEVLLPALIEPLGLKSIPPRQQAGVLASTLKERGVTLIVLDNAANSYALSVLLEYLPAELPVLVTSRLRLPRLPRLELHRLPRSSSLELVGQHLTGLEPAPDPYTLDALCAILGDHPYALRLAAVTLTKTLRPARELLQVLSDSPHALGEEHSVKALLQQSLNALDAESYEAYLGMGSLFTPQTTPELLALALRRSSDDTERALYTLQQHGLTSRDAKEGSDSVTFRMHELTWHDAKAHAALQAKTVLVAVREYAEGNTKTPDNLYSELPNLIAAAQYADKHEPQELVKVMSGWLGGQYIAARGFPVGYLELLKKAVNVAADKEDWAAGSLLGGKLGDIYQMFIGDVAQAIPIYLSAAHFARNAGLVSEQATRLSLAGVGQTLLGMPEAEKTLGEAKILAERSGDTICLCRILGQQGISFGINGHLKESYSVLGKAKDILDNYIDFDTEGLSEEKAVYVNIVSNLGQASLSLGKLDEALEFKKRSLEIAKQSGDIYLSARAHINLAEVFEHLHSFGSARLELEQALCLYRSLGAVGQETATRQLIAALPSS